MKVFALAAALLFAAAAPAFAWWPQGHSIISEAAVRSLPPEMPEFFRRGFGLVAHCAQDPDLNKNPGAPAATDREAPEHFINLEDIQGRTLPATRSKYIELCYELKLKPEVTGYLPYAVAEWMERLSISLAEHRRWPRNPYIQTKCLVYAGILSHYTGDLCMPLHVTVDYDGRAGANGLSPHSGIHARVDSLIEKLPLNPLDLAARQNISALSGKGSLLPGILEEVTLSHSLIDRTYALEKQLPPEQGAWTASPELTIYVTERGREATRFTAAMMLTAWQRSAFIKLPKWLDRQDGG